MQEDSRSSFRLGVVEVAFFLLGLRALVHIFAKYPTIALSFDFDLLGIPIGLGLYFRREIWRRIAIVYQVIVLALIPVIFAVVLCYLKDSTVVTVTTWTWYGSITKMVPASGERLFWTVALVFCWILNFWMYRILVRPDIRSQFSSHDLTRAANA